MNVVNAGGEAKDNRETVLRLDPVPDAPALARDFLTGFAYAYAGVAAERLEDGCLVVSELVANAVLHAATPLSVYLHVTADHLEIAVVDQGPGTPRLLPPDPGRIGGLGLALVDKLADSWGVNALQHGGKLIWCRLKPRPQTAEAAT